MKTISEMIESAYRAIEKNNQSLGIPTANAIPLILKERFSEPWRDAPDEPGWWWQRYENPEWPELMRQRVVYVGDADGVLWSNVTDAESLRVFSTDRLCRSGLSWQRVIGPQ
jgi:hypothetical protein